MCQGGPWISALNLWIKLSVIHRWVSAQLSSPVINWAQERLFTGLNPQKRGHEGKCRPRKSRQCLGDVRGNGLKREKQTGTNGLSVSEDGLFTDTEAGKDPSQQVIGAECTCDFPQQLLRLTQILCQKLPCPRQGQLCPTVLQRRAGMA